MSDIMRRPERRIDDIQTILKGKEKIKGVSIFGRSKISTVFNEYVIDVATSTPEMRIYLVVDGSGKLKHSGRYFDREPGSKPLSPIELESLKEPVFQEDIMIDEALATFQEGININPHEKEIVMQEVTEEITKATRSKVIDISNLDANSCKAKSSELQTKKSEIAPSVINSFINEDWKIIISEVRQRVESNNHQQAA